MNLTKEEYKRLFKKNIDLTHTHLLNVLKDPSILEQIPEGAHVILIPLDDEWQIKKNMELAEENVKKGEVVLLMPMKHCQSP